MTGSRKEAFWFSGATFCMLDACPVTQPSALKHWRFWIGFIVVTACIFLY